MMIEAGNLSRLIGTVYDAVLEPGLWQDVLGRMCRQLEASASSVHVVSPTEGRVSLFVEHGTDPHWTALLLAKYAAMSPVGAAVLTADLDQPFGLFDFVDEEEYVESRFYKEWCAPQSYFDMLGAIIAKKPSQVGAVAVTRSRERGRFGAEDRAFISHVAPHVRRAVTLSGLLERQAKDRAAIAGVIDRLATAVLIVDASGTIQRANASAEAAIEDGKILTRRGGLIAIVDEEASAHLAGALAADGSEPHFIVVGKNSTAPHLLVLMPLDQRRETFALFLNAQDPETEAIAKPIATLFGLTPREVTILLPMLEGKTIEEIAETLGISLATARTHLARLFAKTGTGRQADLVQKVMSALPPVRT
jgi:DNA-binding CsgD family transcriptional regulator